jgi:hypothetical protein
MTVHYYNATLADTEGKEFHATVFWDKLKPGKLTVHVCPRTGPSQVGYPVWSHVAAGVTRSGFSAMVEKLKRKALAAGWRVVEERATEFAAKLREGDEN